MTESAHKAVIVGEWSRMTSFGLEQEAQVAGMPPMTVILTNGPKLPAGTEGIAEYRTGPTYGLWFFIPKRLDLAPPGDQGGSLDWS